MNAAPSFWSKKTNSNCAMTELTKIVPAGRAALPAKRQPLGLDEDAVAAKAVWGAWKGRTIHLEKRLRSSFGRIELNNSRVQIVSLYFKQPTSVIYK